MSFIDQHILDRLDTMITLLGGPRKEATGQRYYNTISTVEEPGYLKIDDTAETTFYNMGTSNVSLLGGLVLTPGQGIGFSGNEGEIDTTKYTYTFTGAGINKLIIIQKLYVNGS